MWREPHKNRIKKRGGRRGGQQYNCDMTAAAVTLAGAEIKRTLYGPKMPRLTSTKGALATIRKLLKSRLSFVKKR